MEAWIGSAIEEVRQKPGDKPRRTHLARMCDLIIRTCGAQRTEEQAERPIYSWSWNTKSSLNDSALGFTAKAALQMENPALLESAVATAKDSIPLYIYPILGEKLIEVDLQQWQRA